MWLANFLIAGSITMVQPFLSLYVDTLGNFSDDYVQTWSGLIFSVTFVSAFIFSPIWGKIGDRVGRKPILVMFGFGLSLSLLLMGFVTSILQLFFLRLFMGVFTGFIALSQALISTQTSKRNAGKILGTLQTGSITGTLMGPLLGGILADAFGYQSTFKWLSLVIFLSSILVLFGIKEFTIQSDSTIDQTRYTSRQVILHILRQPVLLIIMLLSTVVQIANFSVQPILPLFVGELNGSASIAFFSGLTFSASGLGNLMFSRRIGRLGDKHGYIKLMTLMLILGGLSYFPGGFVTALWQLIILRFLMGIFIGGVIPLRIAYIRQAAPIEMQGEVLGYNTSLRFFGNMIGPLLGATISASFGYSAVFLSTASLLFISGIIMIFTIKRYPDYAVNNLSNN